METEPKIIHENLQEVGSAQCRYLCLPTSKIMKPCISWKADPCCKAVDALQQKWTHEFPYAFPSFCLIGTVARKVEQGRTRITLITATWQSQSWYLTLLRMSIRNPLLLPSLKKLLLNPQREYHPLEVAGNLTLATWILIPDLRHPQITKPTFYCNDLLFTTGNQSLVKA